MQSFLKFSLLFLFAAVYGQSVSDYQYIFVPKEFADAKANRFDLNELLTQNLRTKKYIIINDIIETNCETLKAEISDTGNMFTNRVRVEFTDCHKKIVAAYEAKSIIKETDEGMQDALKKALKSILISNPVEKEIVAKNPEPIQIKTIETANQNPETKVEVFSNGTLSLNKINISENQFILVETSKSIPFATFNKTTKEDTFRVVLEDKSMTLGYLENGNYIIEIPNADGSNRKEIFKKK